MRKITYLLFALALLIFTSCDEAIGPEGSVSATDAPALEDTLSPELLDSMYQYECDTVGVVTYADALDENPGVVDTTDVNTIVWDLNACKDVSSSSSENSSSSDIAFSDRVLLEVTKVADEAAFFDEFNNNFNSDDAPLVLHSNLPAAGNDRASVTPIIDGAVTDGPQADIYIDRIALIANYDDHNYVELSVESGNVIVYNDLSTVSTITYYIVIDALTHFTSDATIFVGGYLNKIDAHISYDQGNFTETSGLYEFSIPLDSLTAIGTDVTGTDLLDQHSFNEVHIQFNDQLLENAILDFTLMAVTVQ